MARIAFQEGQDFDGSEVGDSVITGTDVLAVAANSYSNPFDITSATGFMNWYAVETGQLVRSKPLNIDEDGVAIPSSKRGRVQAPVGSPTYYVSGFSGGSPNGGGGPIPGFSPETVPEIPPNFIAILGFLSAWCTLKLRQLLG